MNLPDNVVDVVGSVGLLVVITGVVEKIVKNCMRFDSIFSIREVSLLFSTSRKLILSKYISHWSILRVNLDRADIRARVSSNWSNIKSRSVGFFLSSDVIFSRVPKRKHQFALVHPLPTRIHLIGNYLLEWGMVEFSSTRVISSYNICFACDSVFRFFILSGRAFRQNWLK